MTTSGGGERVQEPGNILQYFTGTPREGQIKVLLDVERTWDDTDVYVITMAVGAGKSRVAHCIASWAYAQYNWRGTIGVPDNILLQQYRNDWPELGAAPPLSHFASTEEGRARYDSARRNAARAGVRLVVYPAYLGQRAANPVVIWDEAHRLIPFLQDKEAVRIWPHLTPVPDWVTSVDALAAWAQQEASSGDKDAKRLARLVQKLQQHPATYVVRRGIEHYRGTDRECISLIPLTPRFNRPILWQPRQVRKIVLMSATLHPEDIYDLGLDQRRVTYLSTPSPIPAEQRPVVYAPVGALTHGRAGRDVDLFAEAILRLLERHPYERGLIHVTYALLEVFRAHPLLADHPRLVWSAQGARAKVFNSWLRGSGIDTQVLVAAGMTEGIDLAGDRARWQAVLKLMYPSRADTAVFAKAKARPAWFAWQAARDLLQATGRVCRGPADYGITYVLTNELGGLLAGSTRSMFPADWLESLRPGRI